MVAFTTTSTASVPNNTAQTALGIDHSAINCAVILKAQRFDGERYSEADRWLDGQADETPLDAE
jgi:hypothetical protein